MTRAKLLAAADYYSARLPETPAKNRAWFERLIRDLVERAVRLPHVMTPSEKAWATEVRSR
jgi:hypothetical protein